MYQQLCLTNVSFTYPLVGVIELVTNNKKMRKKNMVIR
jgi:hypothetical protein